MLDERYQENFKQKLLNFIIIYIIKTLSYLPFWILYGMSDILYVLLRYVFRYRKNIILQNLKNSFPEKSNEEIKSIMAKFYHHFCDMGFETIKASTMSEAQISKRLKVKNIELITTYANQGLSIILMGMHYSNWELSSSIQRLSYPQLLMIVNPMRGNKVLDKFMQDLRERWGGKCVLVNESARLTINFHKQDKPTVLWLAADQTPPPTTKFWTMFLNQETPFFCGPEKIAARSNQPVIFHHTKRIKRGYYEVELYKLFEEPSKVAVKEDILHAYTQKMEEIIKKEPAYYLWSHRRWKHNRPESISLYP